MFVLKGFIDHARFKSNAAHVVAAFGELSTYASTYARDKGLYQSPVSSEMELTTFVAAKDATPIQLTQDVVDQVATVSKFIFDRVLDVHGEIFADELLQDLLMKYAAEAESFECGEIIQDANGYFAPTWVSWRNKSIPTLGDDNSLKVWFSDDAFRNQYDEFEIIVVHPTNNIDDFFKTGSEVETMLKAITPSQTMERAQAAKGEYPETVIRAESYDYVDPYNSEHKVQASWTVLIHGLAGNNVDAINDAIIAVILDQSTNSC